jgi:hypothetical protein
MAKSPGFIFYPGDYLRDTQCLSEQVQVAYDRIMCDHMRNICISQQLLNFFTKRLNADHKLELMPVLTPIEGGFQIGWVADSILKYNAYRASRGKNRAGKSKEHMKIISITHEKHMESESDNENDIVLNIEFEAFWNLYDKKVGDKKKLIKKWNAFPSAIREKIMLYIPEYKKAKPDKAYRKDPQTFFNNSSWDDELIFPQNGTHRNGAAGGSAKLGTSAAQLEAARNF